MIKSKSSRLPPCSHLLVKPNHMLSTSWGKRGQWSRAHQLSYPFLTQMYFNRLLQVVASTVNSWIETRTCIFSMTLESQFLVQMSLIHDRLRDIREFTVFYLKFLTKNTIYAFLRDGKVKPVWKFSLFLYFCPSIESNPT